jgi:hypothetical protein
LRLFAHSGNPNSGHPAAHSLGFSSGGPRSALRRATALVWAEQNRDLLAKTWAELTERN